MFSNLLKSNEKYIKHKIIIVTLKSCSEKKNFLNCLKLSFVEFT